LLRIEMRIREENLHVLQEEPKRKKEEEEVMVKESNHKGREEKKEVGGEIGETIRNGRMDNKKGMK